MKDKKPVFEFASKWYRVFNDSDFDAYRVFDNIDFANECFALKFQMDCGETFCKAFSNESLNDWMELKTIIHEVKDVDLLGSAIFSQWRYFNHWAYSPAEGASMQTRLWFSVALGRLMMLTEDAENCLGHSFAEIDAMVEKGDSLTPELRQLFEEQPEKREQYKFKLWDS